MKDEPGQSDPSTQSLDSVQSGEGETPSSPLDKGEPPVKRRDWVLMPLFGVLTILLLAGSTELIARAMFGESKTGIDPCMVLDDPLTGVRGVPNSVCWEKSPENPPIEFRFNSCGHRAGMECGAKTAGTFRIVIIGSSTPMGERVQRTESLAALLPAELSKRTSRKVEVYNESMGFGFSHSTSLRFNDVLAAHPDLILWVLTPVDIERASLVLPTEDADPWPTLSLPAKALKRLQADLAARSASASAAELFGRTRTALMLRHFLYQSQSESVKSTLAASDSNAGFLRADYSAEWRAWLEQFDSDAAGMEARSSAAGVPFAATLVPARAQAAMISTGDWPKGYDPYRLDDEVRDIITRHGGIYIDLLPDFRTIPHPERYYFPVDGHPNPQGHAALSAMLSRGLTDGELPALDAKSSQQTSSARGK